MLDSANSFILDSPFVTSGLEELLSKRAAPTADWSAMGRREHFVQFYESDEFIVNSVAEYVAHGLKANETSIVIVTAEHSQAIEAKVSSFGFDVEAAEKRASYVPLDAREMLSKFMKGDVPDRKPFSKVVGGLIRKATKRGPVRAFGEMVAVLVAEGNPEGAIALEKLWNDLRKKHSFSLFCAYPMQAFANGGGSMLIDHVCDGHTRVIPDESYTSLTSADERMRQIAFLQQRGRQLEAELAELHLRMAARKA